MTAASAPRRPSLRPVTATRYVMPFREGGSLPALVEGDDGRLYVTKFRGAAQGTRALVSEVIAGEIGRALGLPVPELVLMAFADPLARAEAHAEIQQLLRASVGENLALAYLPEALNFDVAARPAVTAELASRVVVFDAYTLNVDRTPRNPNILWSGGALWLIDHGAALYWHHDWDGSTTGSDRPFPLVRDHVLLPWADEIPSAGEHLRTTVTEEVLRAIVALVPDDWFPPTPALESADAQRAAYVRYLSARLSASDRFIEEAVRARAARV